MEDSLSTLLTILASSMRKARVILEIRKRPKSDIHVRLINSLFPYSPVLDTSGTPRSTVSPLDSLLPLGEGGVLPGPEGRDTGETVATVTTLGTVLFNTTDSMSILA